MEAAIRVWLNRLELEPAAFYGTEVYGRGPGPALVELLEPGLLLETEPARDLYCPDCGEGPPLPVELSRNPWTKEICGVRYCPRCGLVNYPLEDVKRWIANVPAFLELVFPTSGVSVNLTELVTGRLWRVGKASWAGRSREVFFARGTDRADPPLLRQNLRRKRAAIIFVPTEATAVRIRPEELLVVPMLEVVSVKERTVTIDQGDVELRVQEHFPDSQHRRKSSTRRKRASRVAKIEALTHEMARHLRAARDHAHVTAKRQDAPELLPRPTKSQLATRTGMRADDVTRCMGDSTARELRYLWEMALDLEQIMDFRRNR